MQVDMDEKTRALFSRYVPDEDLRELGAQALGVLRLALDRALAHEACPARYPLPAGGRTLEHVAFERLSRLPRVTRQALSEQAWERMEAGARLRARHYGVASAINPHAADSVERALPRLALPAPLRAAAIRACLRLGMGDSKPVLVEHGGARDSELMELASRLILNALSGWLELASPSLDAAAWGLASVGVEGLFVPPESQEALFVPLFMPQSLGLAAA